PGRRRAATRAPGSKAWSVPAFEVSSGAPDAGGGHVGPGARERAVEVDRAAGFLDDGGVEPGGARVERSPGDAEVGCEAADAKLFQPALREIAGETGSGRAVGLEERRIAVDVRVVALADNQLCFRKIQSGMQSRTKASLHAVIRPQHLGAVGESDRLKGF